MTNGSGQACGQRFWLFSQPLQIGSLYQLLTDKENPGTGQIGQEKDLASLMVTWTG